MRCAHIAALLCAFALPVRAHDGPPYPIIVDWRVEDLNVSIWADPDVGVGTFYVYLERGGTPGLPDGLELIIDAHPLDDPSLMRESKAELPREGEPFQLVAELQYDFRGTWPTRFRWSIGERSGERLVDIAVTPPGLGPFDILWYLFPFLGVGFLWVKALLRRRAPPAPSPDPRLDTLAPAQDELDPTR